MASFNVGRLVVSITADLKKFHTGLANAQSAMVKWGKNMQRVGMAWTRSVSAPLAAIGGLALKASADFDKAMAQSTAIMGDLSEAMHRDLEKTARDVARSTVWSAREAAAAPALLVLLALHVRFILLLAWHARVGQLDTFRVLLATRKCRCVHGARRRRKSA